MDHFVSVVDADRGVAVMGGGCTVPPLPWHFVKII